MSAVQTIIGKSRIWYLKDSIGVTVNPNTVEIDTNHGNTLLPLNDLQTLVLLLEYARDNILDREVSTAKAANK